MQSGFLNNGPLVSVIIPAYNVDKYLRKCIDSILAQTYKNIEIIVVDDCATDNTDKIIKEYEKKFSNVQALHHPQNMGLFRTRISGVEAAKGEYIAFVDGDDYISIDWIRSLVKCAVADDLDMTIGEFAFDPYGYPNLDPMRINDYDLVGEDAFAEFLKQADMSFSFHVVWNKLYKKELWNKSLPPLKQFANEHGHMTMWEDLVFSSLMWKTAKRVKNTHARYYFYYKGNASAATNTVAKNNKTIEKYLSDSLAALNFLESILDEDNSDQKRYFEEWRANISSIVYNALGKKQQDYEHRVRNAFNYFGSFSSSFKLNFSMENVTRLDEKFKRKEAIISAICADTTEVVSFDVFDTLILRPFMYPTDLFFELSRKLNEDFSSLVNFQNMRITAESDYREKTDKSEIEDITLDDIYDLIEERYCINKALINKIKDYEQKLEVECSSKRYFGKELYELAREAGKKIVIASDMYLPKKVIERILSKNGYDGYSKLYVSSDIKLTKGTGKLFEHIISDNAISKNESLVHIGDNICSDYETPKALGISAFYIPNVRDCYEGKAAGYTGTLYSSTFGKNGWIEDVYSVYRWSPSLRNLVALFINRIYDDPFENFNSNSDYNVDPRVIGYGALGPHVVSVAKWLVNNASSDKVNTIHFVARDGFVIKEAFDIVNHTDVKSNYIRVSRKAMTLADVNSLEDLYSLSKKIAVLSLAPRKIIKYLEPIVKEGVAGSDIQDALRNEGISFEKELENEETYAKCMKILIDSFLDEAKLRIYKDKLRDYFSGFIKEGDYIFDIGYNGRVESALTHLLGFKIGAYYIHTNDDTAMDRQKKYDLKCRTFYPMKPCITGVIREMMLMERGPSTIGYSDLNGRMEPVFEEYEVKYLEDLITKVLQENAITYVRAYEKTFGSNNPDYYFNYTILSAPLEHFLEFSKEFDKRIFRIHRFENDAGGEHAMSVYDFWMSESEFYGLARNKRNELGETPEEELKRVYSSATYRIGSAIMCIPKAVRHAFQKL